MFDAISRLFSQPKATPNTPIDTKLAVAALLVHLTSVDGEITQSEQTAVAGVLQDYFDLSEVEIEKLLDVARQKDAEAVDLYQFTSAIVQLEIEQRIEIIRMMWTVVFADHKNHELEDNLVWRVAELIGVSSRDRTKIRAQMKTS